MPHPVRLSGQPDGGACGASPELARQRRSDPSVHHRQRKRRALLHQGVTHTLVSPRTTRTTCHMLGTPSPKQVTSAVNGPMQLHEE